MRGGTQIPFKEIRYKNSHGLKSQNNDWRIEELEVKTLLFYL